MLLSIPHLPHAKHADPVNVASVRPLGVGQAGRGLSASDAESEEEDEVGA